MRIIRDFNRPNQLLRILSISVLLCLSSFYTQAQYTISGPSSAVSGEIKTYTITNSNISQIIWNITGGLQNSTSNSGNTYTVDVDWNQANAGNKVFGSIQTLDFELVSTNTINVTVSSPPPSTPVAPTVSSQVCGTTTLSRGTPPSGVVWYWQGTTALGTSTSNSNSTYNITTDGTYYLRAYESSTQLWSTSAASVVANVNEVPSVPSTSQESSKTGTSFTANWSSATGAVSYRLDVSENSGFSSFVSGYNNKSVTGTSHTVSGLTSGKNYYYRLRSISDASCASANSTVITANTTIAAPNALAESGNAPTTFVANWAAVSGVSNFLLYVSENSSFSSHVSGYNAKAVTGTNHTVTGLIPGKNYYYRLKSDGPNADSGYSGQITANTTIFAPTAQAESSNAATSFVANWTAVSGVSNFLLYVSENSSFSSHVSGYNGKSVTGTSHTVTGLLSGKNYYYRLKSDGPNADSGYSGQITANTTIAAPTALTESSNAVTSFVANWAAVSGVSNFLLYVSENSSFSSHVSGYNGKSVTGTSHTVTGLLSGKNYYYRLKSDGANADSGYSGQITANTTIAAPTALFETSNSPTSFVANWTAVSGVSNFLLYVSENSSFSSHVSGYNAKSVTGTSHSITGLQSGKNYYYRLKSDGSNADSGYSGIVTANTTIAAPTAQAASSTSATSFVANWAAVSGVSNFLLYVSESSSFSTHVTGYNAKSVTGTSHTVTGLLTGKTYYYRLKSDGPNADSGYSGQITTTTTIAAPTALAESGNAVTSFVANWAAVSGVSNFLLYVSDNSSFSSHVSGYNGKSVTGTSHTVTGLLTGKNYYYRLKSDGPDANSGYSGQITANTTITAPNAQAASSNTTTTFVANWAAVSGVSNFLLYVSDDDQFSFNLPGYNGKSVTGTSHTVTGLLTGKNYYYRLKSVGSDANSGYSGQITATTTITAPAAQTASSTLATSFVANWTAVSGVSNFLLYVSENSSFSSHITGYNGKSVTGTSHSVTGLLTGKSYYYRLKSVGPDASSGYSGNIAATTTIAAPTAQAASSTSATSFVANWAAVSGVSNFLLYVSENSSFSSHLSGYNGKSVTGTSHTVTGLFSGKNYYYRLKSAGPDANSGYSGNITANTTIAAPTAQAASSNTATSFVANWTAVSGVSDFLLYVSENNSFSTHVTGYNGLSVTGTSHTVTGLLTGKTYYYRLKSDGSNSDSGYSGNITTTTTIAAPTAQAASSNAGTSFVSNWAAVSGVSNFLLYVSDNSNFSSHVSGYNGLSVTGTSHTVTGLLSGKNYYYRLKSDGPDTNSGYSGQITTITTIAAPTAQAASINTATAFAANWTAVSGVSDFLLYVSDNSSFSTHVTGYNGLSVTGTSHTVTGLLTGKTYYYRLKSDGPNSDSGYSGNITTTTTIAAPTAQAASSNTATSFVANWTAVSGVSNFLLYVSDNSSFSTHVTGYNGLSVTGTSHTVTGLLTGKTYYYRLKSDGSDADSGYSGNITTTTTIAAPTAQAASSNTATSFVANWTAVSGVSNFLLYVSENSSFSSHVTGYNGLSVTGTSHTVTGLLVGKSYYYRLKSDGPDDDSGYSGQITATTTIAAPTPQAASSNTATAFTANWDAPSGVSNFLLYVSENSSFSTHVTGFNGFSVTGTSHTVIGLLTGKNYYYRLKSVGPDANSGYSGNITATTTIAAPTTQAASGNAATSFVANWAAVSGVSNFLLYVSETSSFSTHVTGYNGLSVTGTSHTVTGLLTGKSYYYRLKSDGPDADSGYSGNITATTTIAAPTTQAASGNTATSFVANWTAVSGVSNFLLYVSENSSFSSHVTGYNAKPVTGISHTVTGLLTGKNYYYHLKSVGPDAESSYSGQITTTTTIAAPTAQAASSNAATSFVANWTAVSGVSSFLLYVSENSSFSSHVTGYNGKSVTGTSHTVTGLLTGKSYYYRLKSAGPDVNSSYSGNITATTTIAAPTAQAASSNTATSFAANWTAVSGVSNFLLYVSENSSFSSHVTGYNAKPVTGTSHTVTGLLTGKSYYYRLKSDGPDDDSGYSGQITATTTIAAPTAQAASSNTAISFVANWTAVSGVSNFLLYVSENSSFSSHVTGYNGLSVTGISHTVTGLLTGKNYYYRLKSDGPDADSGYSGQITASTTIAAPTALAASSNTTTSFVANWTAVSGVSNFLLYVSENSSFSSHVSGYNGLSVTGTSHTVTGLLTGKNYYYRLKSDGPDDDSNYSGYITASTTIAAPTALAASSNAATTFVANWTAVSGVSNFLLYVSDDDQFSNNLPGYNGLSVTGTSHTVTGLFTGKNYYYRLKSVGPDANSGYSGDITATTTIAAPTALFETSKTTTSFVANWTVVSGVSNFLLYVSENDDFSTHLPGYNGLSVTGINHTVTGLSEGTNYYYRLKSVGPDANSDYSGAITANTALLPIINVVGNTNLAALGDKVTLSASGYDSYTWKKDGILVETGSEYIANLSGAYTVTVTRTGISESGTSAAVVVTGCGDVDPGDHNYIMATTILTAGVTSDLTTDAQIGVLTSEDRSVSIQYADDLGRGIQTIGIEASPNKDHLVQAVVYDAFGRQQTSYLPYVVTDTCGIFQINPVGTTATNYTSSPQYLFYQGTGSIASDTMPYAQTIFESSPLNRTSKQGAPGAAWQPVNASTTDHVVRASYKTNAANEVRSFTDGGGLPVPVSLSGYYGAGQLSKNITEDEEGNEVVTFTDKSGQTILKRVATGDVSTPWADTYYVYDDYGNLSVVLPPEAVEAINTGNLATVPAGYTLATADLTLTSANYSGGSYMYVETATITLDPGVTLDPGAEIVPYSISLAFLDQWAFQYRYNKRNLMSQKRVPGAGWVYMVYDRLDRLVATQDANQRITSQWTFTKYDVLSRPILTGFYTHSAGTPEALQTVVDGYTDLFEIDGTAVLDYTNTAFPNVSNADDYLTATYYDDYANLPSDFTFSYVQELGNGVKNENIKGQVVGSKTKVLDGTNSWLKSVVYYDDRYRVLQSQSDNHLGGTDRTTSKYDFVGRVLETKSTHDDGNTGTTDIVIAETFDYDHASRLLEVEHQINSDSAVLLVKNEYNELGELIDKKMHSEDNGSTFEQSVDFRYNIRGWLERINDAALSDSEGDYFGMELAYNNTFSGVTSTGLFNGNISAAKWSNFSNGGDMQSAYAYGYDGLNRLKTADYQQKDGAASWADLTKFGVENLDYDLNGNIQNLTRYHTDAVTPMDSMTYSYTGNQLFSVTDNGDDLEGFKDGNTSGDDYSYDANGNMTSDANKDITSISYNHLNLPKMVTFTGGRSITYTYDAAGIKLAKSVNDNGITNLTDYSGAFIYEDSVLQQLAHAEGRVRKKANDDFVYDYYLKDHLGNTRITFTTENEEVIYLATMETEHETFEEGLFLNMDNSRVVSTAGNYTIDATITANEAARLNGSDSTRRVGPGKLMTVSRGDSVDIEVYAHYTGGYTDNGSISQNTDFLTALATAFGGVNGGTAEQQATYDLFSNNVSSAFVGTGGSASAPRAYLNYILFDQDFNYVDAGFDQVTTSALNSHEKLTLSKSITEGGYIYMYVSNESNTNFDVFFDDLRITHTKGRVLQEDHYYPFGLNISALSSTAPLSKPNNFKYNGFELEESFDLGWYDYQARQYDPQLGRFLSVDPAADLMRRHGTYNYAFNNPIRFIDPDGMMPEDQTDPECETCDEGIAVLFFSPMQARSIKKALANGDWARILEIFDFAANNGFVDDEGKSSDFINRKLDSSGEEEQSPENRTVIKSDDKGGREIYNFFGVQISEDGNAEIIYLGSVNKEREKLDKWMNLVLEKGLENTNILEGGRKASINFKLGKRIDRYQEPTSFVNFSLGTGGGSSGTDMAHDGIIMFREFLEDYQKNPAKYERLKNIFMKQFTRPTKKKN